MPALLDHQMQMLGFEPIGQDAEYRDCLAYVGHGLRVVLPPDTPKTLAIAVLLPPIIEAAKAAERTRIQGLIQPFLDFLHQ